MKSHNDKLSFYVQSFIQVLKGFKTLKVVNTNILKSGEFNQEMRSLN